MKTLDEVIHEMEGCGYIGTLRDALRYLVEFNELTKMWNDYLDRTMSNPPLSWYDLKKFEGKPVWVVETPEPGIVNAHWSIFHGTTKTEFDVEYALLDNEYFEKEDMGEYWKAYRRKLG